LMSVCSSTLPWRLTIQHSVVPCLSLLACYFERAQLRRVTNRRRAGIVPPKLQVFWLLPTPLACYLKVLPNCSYLSSEPSTRTLLRYLYYDYYDYCDLLCSDPFEGLYLKLHLILDSFFSLFLGILSLRIITARRPLRAAPRPASLKPCFCNGLASRYAHLCVTPFLVDKAK
jgi:hypothetical protein